MEGISERLEFIRWEMATSRASIARSRLVLNVLGILLVFGIYLGLIVNVKSMAIFDANQLTAPPPATAPLHLPQWPEEQSAGGAVQTPRRRTAASL